MRIPQDFFADFRAKDDWQRFAVNTTDERAAFLRVVAAFLVPR